MGSVSETLTFGRRVARLMEQMSQLAATWRERSRSARLTPEQRRALDRMFDRR